MSASVSSSDEVKVMVMSDIEMPRLVVGLYVDKKSFEFVVKIVEALHAIVERFIPFMFDHHECYVPFEVFMV